MFGYVKPVKRELLVKDYEFYRATYCGICRAMKRYTGYFSNAFLTYDSVFLALLRMVYLPDGQFSSRRARCIAHPIKSRQMLVENDCLEYTAKAFAILTYHKLMDDVRDEGFPTRTARRLAKPFLAYRRVAKEYPGLADRVAEGLKRINALEDARCESADLVGEAFGEVLGAVFSEGLLDEACLVTSELGRSVGKFIYVADAAEDYDEDLKCGKYNPLVIMYGGRPLSAENRRTIHTGLLLECKRIEGAVNLLPFGTRRTLEDLIRNIIYLGLPDRISFLEGENE